MCPYVWTDLNTSTHQCMHMLIQVRATDNGSPPRHTDHSLTINILDVNDNAPVIESQRGYNVSINEVGTHSYNTWCKMLILSPCDLPLDLVSVCLYVSLCVSFELKLNNVINTGISGDFQLAQ